ncbi:MAG: hypothetical protein AAGU75_25350, partial [Bacillota bacterium]
MGKKIITKGICLGLCMVLLAGMTGVTFAAEAAANDLYRLENSGTYSLFTNYVQGYSLNVDQGMQTDMSYS